MNDVAQRINKKVCFIGGAAHSGTTLLGLILGSHPACFYCGEAIKTQFLQDQTKLIQKRVCKICGPNCPIWGDLILSNTTDLYEQVSAKTQRAVVIDSTKDTNWLEKQISSLKNTSSQSFLLILQRDGRAVINSWIRKHPNMEVKELINAWIKQIQMTDMLFHNFEQKKLKIHYEALATEPITLTQKICDFLEIDYHPEMINYYQHKHHPLGGNSGTQSLIARAQNEQKQASFFRLSERKKYYYQEHDLGITLDLRWQQELDRSTERLFEEMAGRENAELKWEA